MFYAWGAIVSVKDGAGNILSGLTILDRGYTGHEHLQSVGLINMNGWSDFVFKKEYNLPTLEEVEKHIAGKGYLPNIPSEEEVLKDGIYLGEMNSKLLQKIEEMTLYIIK